jgi:hypothetical protein
LPFLIFNSVSFLPIKKKTKEKKRFLPSSKYLPEK